jgi:hypothetical protein
LGQGLSLSGRAISVQAEPYGRDRQEHPPQQQRQASQGNIPWSVSVAAESLNKRPTVAACRSRGRCETSTRAPTPMPALKKDLGWIHPIFELKRCNLTSIKGK